MATSETVGGGTPAFARAPVLTILGIVLLLHLLFVQRYGFFRDELYFLACADRLDWGYVDHPPLCVLVLKAFVSVFGPSLAAVRLAGILASCGSVLLYARIARQLGGGPLAQTLSAVFAGLTPVMLVVSHLYSMNSLDVLLWAGMTTLWIDASQGKKAAWVWMGIVGGLALLSKLSALWLFSALALATVSTRRRTDFKEPRLWAGLALAVCMFAPHLAWQAAHGNPTREFAQNAAMTKLLYMPPHVFLATQVVVTNPVFAALWVVGLWQGLKREAWRPLALTFALILAFLLVVGRSRENYLAPAFCLVVPIGARCLAAWLEKAKWRKTAFWAVAGVVTPFTWMLAMPILPPESFIALVKRMPVQPKPAEAGAKSDMQGFADMFGWPEMAQTAESVWRSLPEPERKGAAVFGSNYGEASAVAFFRQDRSMNVIGAHNNWWIWGPGEWSGGTLIVVGGLDPTLQAMFEDYRPVATLDHPYAVPEERNARIYLAKGLKVPVGEFWASAKRFR